MSHCHSLNKGVRAAIHEPAEIQPHKPVMKACVLVPVVEGAVGELPQRGRGEKGEDDLTSKVNRKYRT